MRFLIRSSQIQPDYSNDVVYAVRWDHSKFRVNLSDEPENEKQLIILFKTSKKSISILNAHYFLSLSLEMRR